MAFKTSALLLGMIIGGFLAEITLRHLFLPVIGVAAGGLILSFFLVELKATTVPKDGKPSQNKHSTARYIFMNKGILALFAVGLAANFAFEPADQFWQVLFAEAKSVPLFSFGLMNLIFNF